jgi:hypothetical protein
MVSFVFMNKNLTLFVLMGIFYNFTEVTYNAFSGLTIGLTGSTSLWMTLVGGFLGVMLEKFSKGQAVLDRKSIYTLRVLAGALAINIVEFVSGSILNLWLGMDLWDYSHEPLNILGQVSAYHAALWLLFTPFVFWLGAVMDHYIADEKRPYPLYSYYLDFFRRETPLDD